MGILANTASTIPSVREHTAARGPGWRPAGSGRVVVRDEDLADEGRLLADELKLAYAGDEEPRQGDVELALTSGEGEGAGPESYTLTVKNRRVRIGWG